MIQIAHQLWNSAEIYEFVFHLQAFLFMQFRMFRSGFQSLKTKCWWKNPSASKSLKIDVWFGFVLFRLTAPHEIYKFTNFSFPEWFSTFYTCVPCLPQLSCPYILCLDDDDAIHYISEQWAFIVLLTVTWDMWKSNDIIESNDSMSTLTKISSSLVFLAHPKMFQV